MSIEYIHCHFYITIFPGLSWNTRISHKQDGSCLQLILIVSTVAPLIEINKLPYCSRRKTESSDTFHVHMITTWTDPCLHNFTINTFHLAEASQLQLRLRCNMKFYKQCWVHTSTNLYTHTYTYVIPLNEYPRSMECLNQAIWYSTPTIFCLAY